MIISIPINLADDPELAKLEEKGVKGLYTSVEMLQEVEGGKTSWIMATSSTPGGSIPTFIAESSMAGQIAAVSLVIHINQRFEAEFEARRMYLIS